MFCELCKSEIPAGNYCLWCGTQIERRDNHTINELYVEWSEIYYRKLAKTTADNYRAAFLHIAPLHNKAINLVKYKELQYLIDSLSFLSVSSLEKIKQLLQHLYKYACVQDIVQTNYANYIVIPQKIKREVNIFTDTQLVYLYQYAKNKENLWWYTARVVLILIFTGMRPSELFKVTKEDVDVKNKFFIGGSKTEAGTNRSIPICNCIWPFVVEMYLNISKSEPGKPSYLCLSKKKRKIVLNSWRERYFYRFMKEIGFNPFVGDVIYKPYSCRHTFASLCYRADMKPEIIEKIIGHTDAEFTKKVYVHKHLHEYSSEIEKLDKMMVSLI